MRDRIEGYGANARYCYFPITRHHHFDGSEFTQNTKFWTLVLHTTTCRYAKFNADGRVKFDYPGQGGLASLAQYGIGAPTKLGQDTVWLGCKTCGTANLSDGEWKAKAQAAIDADKRADAALRAKREAEHQVEKAKDARKWAIIDARNAWIADHAAEIEEVERAAAATWNRENPDLLNLILKEARA